MTEPTLTPVDEPREEEASQRERSKIGFPYGDLNDAITVTRAVHELGDRCGHDQLAPQLGYSTVENGAYTQKLATARHFGLVVASKDGITLSLLGHRLVDPAQEAQVRAEAFLNVPLYKALHDKYRGYPLPPTNIGLEAVLVELGVAAKQKDRARQALQRSADQAGFFNQGRDRLVAPPATVQQLAVISPAHEPNVIRNGGGSGGGDEPKMPTLVRGLIEKLPPREGATWTKEEREQWVKLATLVIDVVYKVEPLMIAAPQNGVPPSPADQEAARE